MACWQPRQKLQTYTVNTLKQSDGSAHRQHPQSTGMARPKAYRFEAITGIFQLFRIQFPQASAQEVLKKRPSWGLRRLKGTVRGETTSIMAWPMADAGAVVHAKNK